MHTYANLASLWSQAKVAALVALLTVLVLAAGSPAALAQGPADVGSNPVTTYASWGNQAGRNEGMVFIYPLESGTNLNLYEATSTAEPITINTLVRAESGAAADVPIALGPLTEPQYFFKLQSNKRVNWELVTVDYTDPGEASRFVASERQTFLGTKFVFHAASDGNPGSEEIVIINPGMEPSTISIEKFNTESRVYDPIEKATDIAVAAGGYVEFTVNVSGLDKQPAQALGTGTGHYRVKVTPGGSPVLVWEGRFWANNMAIGAAPDGTTIGSSIFVSAPKDEFWSDPNVVNLRIVGITNATYKIISSTGPGIPFDSTPIRTGTVALGAVASELDLPEDRLYMITTNTLSEKIQVQYGSRGSPPHGGEMIAGNDGGVMTNPGTRFTFFFEGHIQKSIDVLMPQAGTNVVINGPTKGGITSSGPDQVFHFLPEFDLAPGAAAGLYTVTADKPVWVVLTGEFSDEVGYFVYTSGAAPAAPEEVSSSLGPINLRYCHSAAHKGDAACKKIDPVTNEEKDTTGKIASEDLPATACQPGQPTTGTASAAVTAGDAITFNWRNLNCGALSGGPQPFTVNAAPTHLLLGTVLEMKAEHATNPSVRLRVVPRETEYDFIDNLTKSVKRIVVETLNDGKLLEKWSIAGSERLVIGVRDTVPDVFTSAAVTFWVGHTRFFGAKTIVARAFMGEDEVGVDTRVLSAKPKTTFSELQVYTPANFGNKAFNRLEFSAGPGSWFGLGSAAFNTARPVSP